MSREGVKKHWKVFEAWLNGAEVEYKNAYGWHDASIPVWDEDVEYRVKLFEPKQGDSILASKDGSYWHKEVFVQKIYGDKYLTISRRGYKWDVDLNTMMIHTAVWKYAKPLNE